MSISALNAWRWVYLAEAALAIAPLGRRRWLRATLVLGGALWLGHDLAHGRWRVAPADAVGLICCLAGSYAGLAACVAWAALNPERPPSPFIWSRPAPRGAS
jgi:hypothetical protein